MFIRDLIFGKQKKNIKISHADLDTYVTEYLKKGGKITKLRTGFCNYPIGHEPVNKELERAVEAREIAENNIA